MGVDWDFSPHYPPELLADLCICILLFMVLQGEDQDPSEKRPGHQALREEDQGIAFSPF